MSPKKTPKELKESSTREPTPLPQGYPRDLSDSQSVRTTFRLSRKADNSLKWLKKHHGVKFKDVFDNLCARLLYDKYMENLDSEQKDDSLLHFLADGIKKGDLKGVEETVRKAQVISKGSLRVLNEISKEWKISRDVLVNYALILMKLLREKEIAEEPKRNEKAIETIGELLEQAYMAEEELDGFLKENDPILIRFGYIMVLLENLQSAIRANLDDGTPIDPDEM